MSQNKQTVVNFYVHPGFQTHENIKINHRVEGPISEMDLNVEDYDVVNFSLMLTRGNLLNIGAKYGDQTFSVWINRSNQLPMPPRLKNLGYEWRNSGLYLQNKKVPTVSLETALVMFYAFLQLIPRKVILVGHSSDTEVMELVRRIWDTDTVNMFRGTIAGFADSLVILRRKYRNRKNLNQFSLPSLTEDLLGKAYTGALDDVAYILDIKQEITSRLLDPSDYTGYIMSYEEAVTTEFVEDNLWYQNTSTS